MYAQSLLTALATRYGIECVDASLPASLRVSTADGAELSYLDWGGHGDAIVFLHGGALTAHSWDLVCLGLRDRFHCLALDMRGHGDSTWADEYQIETAVDDVATLLTHRVPGRAHIVGNSLGGVVAAHFAAAHAHRTASLALIDVGPGIDFAATQRIRDYIERTDGLADFGAAIDAGMTVNPSIDREALAYRLLHSMREDTDGRVFWKQDRRRMHDYDYFLRKIDELEHLAPTIVAPTLVVRGARSRVFSETAARACAALFVRGSSQTIDDAGHNVQEANPAALVAALETFFTSISDR